MSVKLPNDLLDDAIPLALKYATTNCKNNLYSCDHYHGLWPLLRKVGLGKTLSGQSNFYLKSLVDFVNECVRKNLKVIRILISGCVDHQALVHLLAVKEHFLEIKIEITVLDLCESPLQLNKWYASIKDIQISTVRGDILSVEDIGLFDCIFTSSFLGYFNVKNRYLLFQKYSNLLKLNGQLIFANRIRHGNANVTVGFSDEQRDAFCAKLVESSKKLNIFGDAKIHQITELAGKYVTNFSSYPFNGEEELNQYILNLPLKPFFIAKSVAPLVKNMNVTGPTVSDGSEYLLVILKKYLGN